MAPAKSQIAQSKKRNKSLKSHNSSSKTVSSRTSGRRFQSAKSNLTRQIKTKPAAFESKKSRLRMYTDKELDLPFLNMTTPAGVQKPRGKKKGKMFIDDQESMMTILSMVNAEKEGQIESKIMKARQLEEIRQARQNETEARQQARKAKLEETKRSLCRKHPRDVNNHGESHQAETAPPKTRKAKKQVSFARK